MRRVYAYVIAIFFLASCSSQTSTPPRIVKFDDVFVGYPSIENECEWQDVDISIFNQKDQKVSFRHRFCTAEFKLKRIFFRTDSYDSFIVAETTIEGIVGHRKLFSIAKLGPHTPTDYLSIDDSITGEIDFSNCEIVQQDKYVWKYFNPNLKTVPPTPKDAGLRLEHFSEHREQIDINRACNNKDDWRYAFKDGIVIQHWAPESYSGFVDVSSITYTSKG